MPTVELFSHEACPYAQRTRMVLLANAGPVAERFYHYLQESSGRATLAQHGFVLPE